MNVSLTIDPGIAFVDSGLSAEDWSMSIGDPKHNLYALELKCRVIRHEH